MKNKSSSFKNITISFFSVLEMNTEKEKKYDRQLRLWGNHGQKALSEASVCLLNVTPTGNEVLKNLVLPGKKKKQ